MKVGDLENEIDEIGRAIDKREADITRMREQFEKDELANEAHMNGLDEETKEMLRNSAITQPFESKVRHLLDEETEAEDAEKIEQIMADMEEFKQNAIKEDAAIAEKGVGYDPMQNVKIIEEIMVEQDKFSLQV